MTATLRSGIGSSLLSNLSRFLHPAGQQGQRILETIKAMLTAAWASQTPPTAFTGN